MKWIKEPVKDTGYMEPMLALSMYEALILLPVFERSLKEYQKQFEKLKDIHEGGEMTERQAAKMCVCEEIVDNLTNLVESIKP